MNAQERWVPRALGLLVGVGVAMLAVTATRVPRGNTVLGVDVAFEALPTGELDISPTGAFLEASGLRPSTSDRAEGTVSVRNQTGSTLDLNVRAVPMTGQLDEALSVEVSVADVVVFVGRLGALREWTDRTVAVGPGQSVEVAVGAWLPPSAASGGHRLVENVMLEFLTEVGA